MPSIFERGPVISPTNSLDPEQAARAAALIVAHEVLGNRRNRAYITMATYIVSGPAGYVVLKERIKNGPDDDEDVTEIKDATGRTIYTAPPVQDPWAAPAEPDDEERT
jgi:hypothetical protein